MRSVGTVASTLIGMLSRPAGKSKFSWRIFGAWIFSLVFICALFNIMAPVSGMQIGAVIPLLIAWSYAIMGLWIGARYLVAGLIVAAVTHWRLFLVARAFQRSHGRGRRRHIDPHWLLAEEGVMEQPDPIIHQPVRLKIMAALKPLPPAEFIEFMRLKTIAAATEGNLGAHIGTLEQAGYVDVEKDFVAKRPRTRVRLTKAGRRAFEEYVAYLRDILDSQSASDEERAS